MGDVRGGRASDHIIQRSIQYASRRDLDNLDPDAPPEPAYRIAQGIADNPHLMIAGRQQVIERGVDVTMNPEVSRQMDIADP